MRLISVCCAWARVRTDCVCSRQYTPPSHNFKSRLIILDNSCVPGARFMYSHKYIQKVFKIVPGGAAMMMVVDLPDDDDDHGRRRIYK